MTRAEARRRLERSCDFEQHGERVMVRDAATLCTIDRLRRGAADEVREQASECGADIEVSPSR
jgi:hypothetical protein